MKKIILAATFVVLCNISYAATEISTAATNLGIGTTSVLNALSIRSTAVIGSATYTSTAAPANGLLVEGNVGIATLAPGVKLDVTGAGRFSSTITASNFSGTSSGTNTGDQTTISGNAGTATALAADPTDCSPGNYPLGVDASGNAVNCTSAGAGSNYWSLLAGTGNVGIGTTNNSVGIGTFMGSAALVVMPTQDGNKNVGIGTWIPSQSLNVIGQSLFSSNVGIGTLGNAPNLFYLTNSGNTISSNGSLTTITSTGSSSNVLTITENGQTTGNIIQASSSNSTSSLTGAAGSFILSGANNVGNAIFAQNSGSGNVILLNDASADPSPFLIDLNGNIGIGTTVANAKISVNGNIGIGTNINTSFITTSPPNGGMIIEGNVGIGTYAPQAKFQVAATVGWTVKAGANTACSTTCNGGGGCVLGFASAVTGSDPVSCADATADNCLCAGP